MSAALLLDTCACLWISGGAKVTETAAGAVQAAAEAGALFISPFTAWEVSRLAMVGRFDLGSNPHLWFARLSARPGVRLAPLDVEVLIESNLLPGTLPRDPADRILIATARRLGCPFVTRDRLIINYARAGHLDVIVC